MTRHAVRTDGAPGAIGPYSQAIRAGDTLFISGQIPVTPAGELVDGDSVHVPVYLSTIKVEGAVGRPGGIVFRPGKSAKISPNARRAESSTASPTCSSISVASWAIASAQTARVTLALIVSIPFILRWADSRAVERLTSLVILGFACGLMALSSAAQPEPSAVVEPALGVLIGGLSLGERRRGCEQ